MKRTITLAAVLSSFVAGDAAAREWRGCSAAIQIVAEGRLLDAVAVRGSRQLQEQGLRQ